MLRTQITLGIVLMVASIAVLAWMGANEEARMARTAEGQLAGRIENGAALYHNNCERCHGERAEGVPGFCPPLNSVELLEQRARETGWAGSVHGFIVNTIRGGRLTSTRPDQYIGETASGMAMPFWSQDFGGPLRNDQIEDIAYFLENYTGPATVVEGPATEPVEITDENRMEVALDLYRANACSACHALAAANASGATGPTHEGMGATAAQRIADPNYTGAANTPEEYIAESIVNPAVYVVEGYAPVMPPYPNLSEDELDALVQLLMEQ
jgi:mono/diheme cytochrome c family protein/cytochrome c551/c552